MDVEKLQADLEMWRKEQDKRDRGAFTAIARYAHKAKDLQVPLEVFEGLALQAWESARDRYHDHSPEEVLKRALVEAFLNFDIQTEEAHSLEGDPTEEYYTDEAFQKAEAFTQVLEAFAARKEAVDEANQRSRAASAALLAAHRQLEESLDKALEWYANSRGWCRFEGSE